MIVMVIKKMEEIEIPVDYDFRKSDFPHNSSLTTSFDSESGRVFFSIEDSDIDIMFSKDCHTANTFSIDIEELRKIVERYSNGRSIT
jgi:hypothetical protein